MKPEEKWAVSHRGNAFRELLRQLKDFEQNAR
jgi:inosine/xanthosine triphosphate pyrophosphatase family protein